MTMLGPTDQVGPSIARFLECDPESGWGYPTIKVLLGVGCGTGDRSGRGLPEGEPLGTPEPEGLGRMDSDSDGVGLTVGLSVSDPVGDGSVLCRGVHEPVGLEVGGVHEPLG
jgi:hypothetical protein